jgi:SAM-dependent methyltransferase
MTDHSYEYPGAELGLFAEAMNWKRRLARVISPHIAGSVLEVGAGLGANTEVFLKDRLLDWTCLEPDHRLADEIERIRGLGRLPASCKVVRGTLSDLPSEAAFGTILYIDVLEHIEDDRAEIASAAARLVDGGRLIVLAPAHAWLFSPFDAAIGHHRRYTKSSLVALAMAPLQVCAAHYLDSIGLLASLSNRFLLSSAMPTPMQIRIWDKGLVPISGIVDALLRGTIGKSVMIVWERVAQPTSPRFERPASAPGQS